ncbi:MAG: hypothetical protein ACYDD1_14925 [Caulobacteraceae bacterium]
MPVVFDANMAIWLLDGTVEVNTNDPAGKPVIDCRAKVDSLFRLLSDQGEQVVIPDPAIAEFLVRCDPAKGVALTEYIRRSTATLRAAPFDTLAAVECAIYMREKLARSATLGDGEPNGRTKAKFDMQIVAIASVVSASALYSSDDGLLKLARKHGLVGIGIWDLPPAPQDTSLFST